MGLRRLGPLASLALCVVVAAMLSQGVTANHRAKRNSKVKLLMVGLAGAGVGNVLRQMNLGQIDESTHAPGFKVEHASNDKVDVTAWDIGAVDPPETVWRPLVQNMNGVIFVVDSAKPTEFHTAGDKIRLAASVPALWDLPLLILANNQNAAGAIPVDEVSAHIIPPLTFQGSSTDSPAGIQAGLNWLYKQIDHPVQEYVHTHA